MSRANGKHTPTERFELCFDGPAKIHSGQKWESNGEFKRIKAISCVDVMPGKNGFKTIVVGLWASWS